MLRHGARARIFSPEAALQRCCNNRDMVGEMIRFFFDEADKLLPQMHEALQKGDLREVGCLGHRLKGTLIYLGAEPTTEAAAAVERFYSRDGQPAEAEKAISMLQHACEDLKTAIVEHGGARCRGPRD